MIEILLEPLLGLTNSGFGIFESYSFSFVGLFLDDLFFFYILASAANVSLARYSSSIFPSISDALDAYLSFLRSLYEVLAIFPEVDWSSLFSLVTFVSEI